MKRNKLLIIIGVLVVILAIYYLFSSTIIKRYLTVFCDKKTSQYLKDNNIISDFIGDQDVDILSIVVYGGNSYVLYSWDKSEWKTFYITYKDNNNHILIKQFDGYKGVNSPLYRFVIDNDMTLKILKINNNICFKLALILYFSIIIIFVYKIYHEYIKK